MGFRILKDEEAIEEIARMSTDHPHRYGSNRPRTFSTPLRSHTEFKYSSMFLEPTFKTIAALKGFSNPQTIERLERIRNKIYSLEESNPGIDYGFLWGKYSYIEHHRDNLHEKLTELEALIEICIRYPHENVIRRFQDVDSRLEELRKTGEGSQWHTKFYDACQAYLQEPHDIIKLYGCVLEIQNAQDSQQNDKKLQTPLYKRLLYRVSKKK